MKKETLTLFLSILSLFSFGQTAEEYKTKAEEKYEIKDYQKAMYYINKAIEADNKNIWYYIFKSEVQLQLTGPADALKVALIAVSLDSTHPEPYSRIGTYYSSGGMPDSAIAMHNKAIHYAKNDTAKYAYVLNRGAAKIAMRDFKGAANDFESVLAFDPKNVGALNNLSATYDELGKIDKSIECLKKLIKIDSTFIGTYVNLGFIYSKLDSFKLALYYFDKAITLDPSVAITYNNRGYVYYKMGEYMYALRDINRSIEMYPTNSYAYRNLALVHLALNKKSDACNALALAEQYGFEQYYGPEVKKLKKKHCK